MVDELDCVKFVNAVSRLQYKCNSGRVNGFAIVDAFGIGNK